MSEKINVREIRGELSQAEFAKLVGVTQPTVWRWENGDSPSGAAVEMLKVLKDKLASDRIAHGAK